MPTFLAIAAISENRAIGYQGKIPWHLPDDFRWFKHKTMGGTLIMGRKTFASIGQPLPGRETIVLSRTPGTTVPEGVTLCDLSTLDEKLRGKPRPYWICGGSEVYRQLLRQCSALYLTRVNQVVEGDAFFPPFEDKFELEQTIFDSDAFTVQRWRRLYHADPPQLEPEAWPFAK